MTSFRTPQVTNKEAPTWLGIRQLPRTHFTFSILNYSFDNISTVTLKNRCVALVENVSFETTEGKETGIARHGRRLEILASHTHRPLAQNPYEAGGSPVSNPKENFSNCLLRPAERVSAHSVVKILDAPPRNP